MGWYKRNSADKRRLFILGWDGSPFSLVTRLAAEGYLPNFSELLKRGDVKEMLSVLPTVSSVAWSSFMTGKSPSGHNIYGFVDRKPDTMEMFVPTRNNMKGRILPEILSDVGKRVISINVPVTYPPSVVNGVLVSGFLATDIDKAVYPQEIAVELKEAGYRIDVDARQARISRDSLIDDLDVTLDRRVNALFALMDIVPDWDFVICHIMETDRLHHFLWEHMEEDDEKYAPAFYEFYRKLDKKLGLILDRIGPDVGFMVLSDHGFCTIKKEVFLNRWLIDAGYLAFTTEEPKTFKDISSEARAYSIIPGRIFINLKGREKNGEVQPGAEYEGLRREIADGLTGLKDPDTSETMIDRVMMREEIYGPEEGHPAYDDAPDLVAVPRNGYDLKGNLNPPELAEKGELVGMHTYDDAFLYLRGHEINRTGFSITDAMPTALELMGVDLPGDIDGTPLIGEA